VELTSDRDRFPILAETSDILATGAHRRWLGAAARF